MSRFNNGNNVLSASTTNNQTSVKSIKAKVAYQTSMPQVDTFDGDLSAWYTTPGVAITSSAINLPSGGTTHTNLALYRGFREPRGMEVAISSVAGGTPGVARLGYGTDLNNWIWFRLMDTVGFFPVVGFVVGSQVNGTTRAAYTPVTGDVIRIVRLGHNVQLFANGTLIDTMIPNQAMVPLNRPISLGIAWRDSTTANNVLYDSAKFYPRTYPKYMHISIDDFIFTLRDLAQGNYSSLWNQPQFKFFKSMHDKYGAVFSLYCFYSDNASFDLSQMPTKFSTEFKAASDWLRLGFHGHDGNVDYNSLDSTTALSHYTSMITAFESFASSYNIDTVPRVHNYAGTLANVQAWQGARMGIKGLLSADDTRTTVYYLNSVQQKALTNCDDLYDPAQKLYFVHTDFRFESVTSASSTLDSRYNDYVTYGGQKEIQCIFTHDGLQQNQKIEDACKWALANDFTFGFPMDYIQIV